MFRIIPRHNINFGKREFLAILNSIKNGRVIYGDKIQEFEAKFAHYCDVRHAITSKKRENAVKI